MRSSLLMAAVVLSAAPALAESTTWDLDPAHSSAQFTVRHMMVSNVHGEFQKVMGTVSLNDKDLKKSMVEATIEVGSLTTGVEKRDGHLKSPDFFDAAKFPTLTFKSTSIAKAGKDKFKVVGDLTMHGVTKPVTLAVTATAPVKDIMGPGQRRGFEATTKLNREDWGLKWNKDLGAGNVLIGNDVSIVIDGELVSHPAEAAAKAGDSEGKPAKATAAAEGKSAKAAATTGGKPATKSTDGK